jgi:hypothetical protein
MKENSINLIKEEITANYPDLLLCNRKDFLIFENELLKEE